MLEVNEGMVRDKDMGLKRSYSSLTVKEDAAGEVIKFQTTRFGELSVSKDKIITFPSGILGFPDIRRFIILDYEADVPFKWLQSLGEPSLAFLIVEPNIIKPDFSLRLREAEIADLEDGTEEDIAVFVILTVPDGNPTGMTANLRGPIVINSATMKGKQIILQDDRYAVRHPVLS